MSGSWQDEFMDKYQDARPDEFDEFARGDNLFDDDFEESEEKLFDDLEEDEDDDFEDEDF